MFDLVNDKWFESRDVAEAIALAAHISVHLDITKDELCRLVGNAWDVARKSAVAPRA